MSYRLPDSQYTNISDSGFVTYYLAYQFGKRLGRCLWIQVRLNGLYTDPIPAVIDDFGSVVALV